MNSSCTPEKFTQVLAHLTNKELTANFFLDLSLQGKRQNDTVIHFKASSVNPSCPVHFQRLY